MVPPGDTRGVDSQECKHISGGELYPPWTERRLVILCRFHYPTVKILIQYILRRNDRRIEISEILPNFFTYTHNPYGYTISWRPLEILVELETESRSFLGTSRVRMSVFLLPDLWRLLGHSYLQKEGVRRSTLSSGRVTELTSKNSGICFVDLFGVRPKAGFLWHSIVYI